MTKAFEKALIPAVYFGMYGGKLLIGYIRVGYIGNAKERRYC